jgi:multisubunit Na+/H+ antiporter MnhB subunit
MESPSEGYVLATRAFSVLIIGFGVAIVAITLANGGGALSFGLLIGLVFCAMGVGRLYLATRERK